MDSFLTSLSHLPECSFEAGRELLRQGEKRGQLYVLLSGSVEILKNGMQLCVVSERGAILGELSILLNIYHTATVRTLAPSTFYQVTDAHRFLAENPVATLHVAKVIARRLALLDSYFADLKNQFALVKGQLHEATVGRSAETEILASFWSKAERGVEQRWYMTPGSD